MEQKKPNILLIGLGAIGSITAAGLLTKGYDLALLQHSQAKCAHLRQNGFKISGVRTLASAIPHLFENIADLYQSGRRFDYILICTKAIANEALATQIGPLLNPKGLVCLLQNGLNVEEPFLKVLDYRQVARAVLNFAGLIRAPGQVEMTYQTTSYLGPAGGGESERAQELAAILTQSGLTMEYSFKISHHVWEKSLNGVPISVISALTGLTIGEVLKSAHTAPLTQALLQEMLMVANSYGEIFPPDFIDTFMAYNEKAAAHLPSMRSDIANGRVSEARYTIGQIVTMGAKAGIAVPKSQILSALLLAIDEKNSHSLGK